MGNSDLVRLRFVDDSLKRKIVVFLQTLPVSNLAEYVPQLMISFFYFDF